MPTLIAEGGDFAFAPVALSGDDLLFLQYTGGTTGLSKGAALTHRNLVANTEQFKAFMPDALRPGQEVVVTALPLYHIFALMVNFITYYSIGAENWLVPNPRDMDELHRGSARGALHRLHWREHAVRRACSCIKKLAKPISPGCASAIGGGAAVLPTTSAKWKALTGKDILEGYGLSETSPILTAQSDDERRLLGDGRTAIPVHRHQAARRRRPRKRHWARRAKSAPRARR